MHLIIHKHLVINILDLVKGFVLPPLSYLIDIGFRRLRLGLFNIKDRLLIGVQLLKNFLMVLIKLLHHLLFDIFGAHTVAPL